MYTKYSDISFSRKVKRKVVVCSNCEGSGIVHVISDDPRFAGPWQNACPVCKGTGRLRKISVITYEVFPSVS